MKVFVLTLPRTLELLYPLYFHSRKDAKAYGEKAWGRKFVVRQLELVDHEV